MDSDHQASDPAPTAGFQRHLFWLVGLTIVAGATVFIALPFLTGRQSFYHDTLAHVTLELLSKVGDGGFRRRVRLACLRP